MHRFQPIPYIRQRPLNDDAHRIVEKRLLHLFFDESHYDAVALHLHWLAFGKISVIGQARIMRTSGAPRNPLGALYTRARITRC